jgi:hypothetical protein
MLGTRVREGKAVNALASANPAGARNGIVMTNLLAMKSEK